MFLNLTVSPADVDVNLEPNKSRVLLHNKVVLLFMYACYHRSADNSVSYDLNTVVMICSYKFVTDCKISLYKSAYCHNWSSFCDHIFSYFVIVLFQEDVLKLLGDIFEELYGPLPHNDAVNDVVCHISATTSSQLSELATVTVIDQSVVTQQLPAVVSASSVQLSDARPAVVKSSVTMKHTNLTSDVSCQPLDIAKDWSTGTLVTDSCGKSVEVNVLFDYIHSRYCYFCVLLI